MRNRSLPIAPFSRVAVSVVAFHPVLFERSAKVCKFALRTRASHNIMIGVRYYCDLIQARNRQSPVAWRLLVLSISEVDRKSVKGYVIVMSKALSALLSYYFLL